MMIMIYLLNISTAKDKTIYSSFIKDYQIGPPILHIFLVKLLTYKMRFFLWSFNFLTLPNYHTGILFCPIILFLYI